MSLQNYLFPILIIFYFFVIFEVTTFDFLTPIGVGISNWAMSGACYFQECCHKVSIPADFHKLKLDLEERVYGQHIVQDIVVNALKSHWDENYKPSKALTLSFHGWPGSGKNYVSKIIVDNLYKKGTKSKFVHQYIGRVDFPLEEKVEEYQQELFSKIESHVAKCPKQIFIFDEVDKMPPKLLNVLKPMIDYHDNVNGIDYTKCIFIFLSNTGSQQINDVYFSLWNMGRKREYFSLSNFEKMISLGAFNEEGGFYYSDNIKSNLIDHYIPFLPMERHHVRLCILDQFKLRNIQNPKEEHIDDVIEFIEWGPSESKLFSLTGCKRISQKVGAIAAKYSEIYRKEL